MKDTTLKKMLLFIALVSAIMVAMPHTISLFGGQHTWYVMPKDIKPSPAEWDRIPCSKCHPADISRVLSSSGVHPNLGEGNEACAACPRCNLTCYTNASVNGTGATFTVSCRECHENGTRSPHAGRFTNKTNSPYQYTDATHNGTKK